jgi:hypothetical protein
MSWLTWIEIGAAAWVAASLATALALGVLLRRGVVSFASVTRPGPVQPEPRSERDSRAA